MPSLKAIRNRIGAVKNTQKITRAMKMVSAAKLNRAQQAIIEARPYAQRLMQVLHDVALRAETQDHPLLARREPVQRTMLIVVTADRGLCGAFNANIIRRAERYIAEETAAGKEVSLGLVGRKGTDHFRRRRGNVEAEFRDVFVGGLGFADAKNIGDWIVDHYVSAAPPLDEVSLVYNEFKSAVSQKVTVEKLLPIDPTELAEAGGTGTEFIYEPDKEALLNLLLPLYVNFEVFRVLLESLASEHGARMSAMENATTNAAEMLGALQLQYNRGRQAAITKELMEIIGGAEALKG
ncbi:MAG TPA: ATP synthase F1 subunit gamma [Myxococcota bacterium]|jgi:F-type H+-transporting ATPase subunit gamma|nr:ATP synthase F1 subunit gamma [Myxococcota bacterium]